MVFPATPPYGDTLTGSWKAPDDFCYKFPATMTLQEGALCEPLTVGVHIARQVGIKPGDSVVVMEAGPIGLLCAAVAKTFGTSIVCSVDIVESKLEFAKDFCATHTYLSQKVNACENAEKILKLIGLPDGADIASVYVVCNGGAYLRSGMGKADVNFPIMALCCKEVTAYGSFRYGASDWKIAVELVADKKVKVKKLVSEIVEFKDTNKAFNKVKEGQAIKILIAGPNEKNVVKQTLCRGLSKERINEKTKRNALESRRSGVRSRGLMMVENGHGIDQ
ncbi:D-xylulose reductase A [Cytospora mali]|uniref:D-xylulose reductase A n=1 Tax=Cytospora mali TaxID=578113 RepID=A0A194VV17_CYTMA|nr:D-xylulose reductase A [Valsa mali]